MLRHPIVSGAVLIVLSALATVLLTPVDLPSAKLWLLGAFPEAKDSETLIIVAPFWSAGGVVENLPHREIKVGIENEITKMGLQDSIRIEEFPNRLRSDNRERAREIKRRYKASLVIWGDVTGVATTVSYLGDGIDERTREKGASPMKAQVSLKGVQEYTHFVTKELPVESNFFAIFAIARSYADKGSEKIAIQSLNKAISSLPKNYVTKGLDDANHFLGLLYAKRGSYARAEEKFSAALQIDSTRIWTFTNRGASRLYLRKPVKAVRDYTAAVRLDSTSSTLTAQGVAKYVKGDSAGARTDLDRAIDLDSTSVFSYHMRGVLRTKSGDLHGALEDYTKAIQLGIVEKRGTTVLTNRGKTYRKLEKYDLAIADLKRAASLEPKDPENWNSLGVAYKENKDRDKAISSFTKALTLDSSLVSALFNRATTYALKENYPEAVADYNKVLALSSRSDYQFNAYFNRGVAHVRMADTTSALSDFAAAMEFDSQGVDTAIIYFTHLCNRVETCQYSAEVTNRR